jgi:hypothetical protein
VTPAETAPVEASKSAAQLEAPSSVPAPAEVARAALDADRGTIRELRQLQRRENDAWNVRSETSLAWPAVGLGAGSVLSPIMVPLGAVLLATSDHNYESSSDGVTTKITNDRRDRTRRAGSILLGIGLAAVATLVYCSVLVHRRRHAKRSANQELLTVREQRTRILDAITPSAELPSGRAE